MFLGRGFYFSLMLLWIRGRYGENDYFRKLENILNGYSIQIIMERFISSMMPPASLKMWFSPAAFKNWVEKLRSQYLDFCKIAVLLAACNRNANQEKNLMLAREWLKWCAIEFRKIGMIENTATGIWAGGWSMGRHYRSSEIEFLVRLQNRCIGQPHGKATWIWVRERVFDFMSLELQQL